MTHERLDRAIALSTEMKGLEEIISAIKNGTLKAEYKSVVYPLDRVLSDSEARAAVADVYEEQLESLKRQFAEL